MPDNSEKHSVSLRDTSAQPKLDRYWWVPVAAAGVVPALLVSWLMLHRNGYDPVIFLAFGIDAERQVASLLDVVQRPVPVLPGFGHDGRFFFLQAMDPLILDPDGPSSLLGWRHYRAQRIAYPFIASFGGLVPDAVLPWTLWITNLASIVVGTVATAAASIHRGGSRWIGLVFGINIAVIFEFGISSGGVVALAAAIAGVALLDRGHVRYAVLALVVAALAREQMVLFAFGMALAHWRTTKRLPLVFLFVPGSVVAWGTYVRWRLGPNQSAAEVAQLVGPPFRGLLDAVPSWSLTDSSAMNFLMLACLIAAGTIVTRRALSSVDSLAWGTTATIILLIALNQVVWRQYFNIGRAAAVIFLAALVFAFSRREPDPASEARP